MLRRWRPRRDRPHLRFVVRDRETVVPIELFFDLVFVFAFTQVTGLLSSDPTSTGALQGVLLFTVLWWAWAGFARLTSVLDPEEGGVRIAMLAAVAALLIMSLASPRVFGDDALIFAIAYVVLRGLHVVLSGIAARGDRERLLAVLHLLPNAVVAGALLIAASFVSGDAQLACWIAAAV